MAQARESTEYNRHTTVVLILWEHFRSQFPRKDRPKVLKPSDVNPYAPKEQALPGTIEDFKALLRIPKRKPKRAHPKS
jgi:hypothetical protein